eukprot:TRINITY_DN18363_c0_g1_i1.p1 TRINITY_DN18363_c0_g1~~TRINITY_DN18363_c0_g1_i1.p1  ORF type:complete len:338 (+),score=102.47 TRINITY_DN18363_c0_g1_i1:90-1103(+)
MWVARRAACAAAAAQQPQRRLFFSRLRGRNGAADDSKSSSSFADALGGGDGPAKLSQERPPEPTESDVAAARLERKEEAAGKQHPPKSRWPQRWTQRDRKKGSESSEKADAEIQSLVHQIRSVKLQHQQLRSEAAEEAAAARIQAQQAFAREVIAVCDTIDDTLHKATQLGELPEASKQLVQGMELTRLVLVQGMARNGLVRDEPASGDQYDSSAHFVEAKWRYAPVNGLPAAMRVRPALDAPRSSTRLAPDTEFSVSEEVPGDDGVTFVRKSGTAEWLFDRKPEVGRMCERVAAEVPSRAVVDAVVLPGYTLTDETGSSVIRRPCVRVKQSGFGWM